MRRNILITGASSGIGAQLAREFAGMGRNLALCARRTDRLAALRDEVLRGHPASTVSVRGLDVTDHQRVFEVFDAFAAEFGGLDRIVVNAGTGGGATLGTGRFEENRQVVATNFTAGLVQLEAAMRVLRAQGSGHLVVISSVSAFRGLPRDFATYGATKAAMAALAEGLRAEQSGSPITVSTIYPGYIRSEMTEGVPDGPLMTGLEKGARAIATAIERERATACAPPWPWRALGFAMKHMPLPLLNRFA